MSYERAYNLAGTVCRDRGFDKEPAAARGKAITSAGAESNRGRGRGGRGGGRGGARGRGGGPPVSGTPAGSGNRGYLGVTLPNGEGLCKFWQNGNCHDQTLASCHRFGAIYKHLCDHPKGTSFCQGSHKRSEHDPTKH